MSKHLVTGLGGLGKTEVCKLLKERGLFAVDGDEVPNLCSWTDVKTGKQIFVDHTKYVDYSKVAWTWDRKVLEESLKNHAEIYFCGSSSNEFDFFDLFDNVFVLNTDDGTHKARLLARNSDYGKDTQTLQWLIAERPSFVEHAVQLGAKVIDVTGSPEDTVAQILRQTDEVS